MDVGDPPEASSFHLCAELSKVNDHGANACEYAVVRDCAVCVLWAQLKGDSLQALLNILGVEVDDHPALSEVIGTMQSRSCPRLPSLRRRLKSQNGGGQGAAVLTTIIDVLVSSFSSSNVPNVSTGTELGKFKFNIVKNKSLEDRNVCSRARELKVAYDNYKAMVGVSGLSTVGWT